MRSILALICLIVATTANARVETADTYTMTWTPGENSLGAVASVSGDDITFHGVEYYVSSWGNWSDRVNENLHGIGGGEWEFADFSIKAAKGYEITGVSITGLAWLGAYGYSEASAYVKLVGESGDTLGTTGISVLNATDNTETFKEEVFPTLTYVLADSASKFSFSINAASNAGITSWWEIPVVGTPEDTDYYSSATGSLYKIFLTVNTKAVSLVPEPDTYAIIALGLGLIGFSARRKLSR